MPDYWSAAPRGAPLGSFGRKADGKSRGWIAALSAGRGVYLLTCPKTKEVYVGKADGADGFWGDGSNTFALATAKTLVFGVVGEQEAGVSVVRIDA
jgi:hypothetical protein